jgi:hypothetical protein
MSLSEYLNLILERDLANRNLESSDESKEQWTSPAIGRFSERCRFALHACFE